MRCWKVFAVALTAVSMTASIAAAMEEVDVRRILSEKRAHDLAVFGLGQPQEKEKAAYLGVSATPEMPAVLRKQLGLPKRVGMLVEHVDPDGPAKAAGVQKDDILHKLGDQLIINQHQLAALVRTHKPGSEVTLTVIRQAKQEQITVKLMEKELPKLRLPGQPRGPGLLRETPQPGAAYLEALSALRGAVGGRPLTAGQTKITLHDGDQVLTITIDRDGKRHLVVKDGKGEVLFEGPVESLERRQADLEKIRKKLEKMEKGLKAHEREIRIKIRSPETAPAK
jgi:serine protease Do